MGIPVVRGVAGNIGELRADEAVLLRWSPIC